MDGVELFLLGRTLMKIGEGAMPEPEGGAARYGGGVRSVLIVVSDLATHPDSAVGEIAARTGLPQSQVSTAVARLKEAGAVVTNPDPAGQVPQTGLTNPLPGRTQPPLRTIQACPTPACPGAHKPRLTGKSWLSGT